MILLNQLNYHKELKTEEELNEMKEESRIKLGSSFEIGFTSPDDKKCNA